MGHHLAQRPLCHGELIWLSRILSKSPRTLRNWRDREGESRSPGRPRHTSDARELALAATTRVWTALPRGQDGWRSVCAQLAREERIVPVRLVQASLSALKRAGQAKERARIAAERTHVDVLARNAVWALDKAQVGRDVHGKVEAQAVREGVVPRVLALSVGPPPHGRDTAALLEAAARQRGAWPLVLQMDNGSENRNSDVEAVLQRERVIALWNVPHTPEHNPRAERVLGSLKRASGVSGGERMRARAENPTRRSLCARLFVAWKQLDEETSRDELCGLTPAELDRIAPEAEDRVRRARFYRDVSEELERVVLAPENARARRKLEREVIWCALERHGLVTRTRGGCPIPTVKAEGIS